MSSAQTAVAETKKFHWNLSGPFLAVHLIAAIGVLWTGWSWKGLAVAIGLYYARMLFVTAAYHRYFSHRTFKTSRWFQFVLAFLAQTSSQKGVLWWAGHHRQHHKLSDKPGDIHSLKLDGFLWSHVAWILSTKHEATAWDEIPDLAKYPELRWLNRWHLVPVVLFAVGTWLVGGWFGFLWGFFVSMTLLWHGTFTINSLCHFFCPFFLLLIAAFLFPLVLPGGSWHAKPVEKETTDTTLFVFYTYIKQEGG